MKAISLRRGFATNSSSSHSIIFSADPSKLPDGISEYSDFGWNYFVQKTKVEKLRYIYQSFSNSFDSIEEMAEFFDVPVDLVEAVFDRDGYIDHESAGMLDMDSAKAILHDDRFAILGGNDNDDDPQWVKSFQKIKADDMRYISRHYKKFLESGKDRQVIHTYNESIALEKGVVTIFNNQNGVKVRYNMEGDGEVYLSVPELVDIKITDYCPYGCSYCYQNSTEQGLHADYDKLVSMIELMKEKGVFELAIGGGEPTLHPQFHNIIEACNKKNDDGGYIVPNFTTRNLSVFKKGGDKTYDLLTSIGGFAYSVDGVKDVKKIETLVKYWLTKAMNLLDKCVEKGSATNNQSSNVRTYQDIAKYILGKVSIQIVLGAMSRDTYMETIIAFNKIIDRMKRLQSNLAEKVDKFNRTVYKLKRDNPEKNKKLNTIFVWNWNEVTPTIMLLGYKTTGRGSVPDYDYTNNALSDITKVSNKQFNVGIDTAAAQQMAGQIQEHKVPKEFYYVKEGVASCYIDAVQETMASSSYCPEVDSNNMDNYSNDTFIDEFKKYQKQGLNAIPLNIVA